MTLDILLAPPITFVFYLVVVGLIAGAGRALAGPGQLTPGKTSTYAGGEASPTRAAAPGYKPFFVVSLFFAILHLGVLMLGSGALTPDTGPIMGIYLAGLLLALLTLILG